MGYPGGKSSPGVFHTLINLMPPHDVYIEPFLGGGAVMAIKRRAGLNIGIDLDRDVITGWRSRLTAKLPGASSSSRPALRRFGAAALAPSLEQFRFDVADGIEFLRGYQFTGSELVYCDPPYVRSTRSSPDAIYRHEMTDAQHLALLDVLRRLKCMVMVSGYSSPMYAKGLKGWTATAFQTTARRGLKAEWVWMNYEKPVALHDYRFLGVGHRERQDIRRQQNRWVGRLAKMPVLRRQALLAAIGGEIAAGGHLA